MSDDSKDNPPKRLKLSRDLKNQVDSEEVKATPAMKLKRPTESIEPPAPVSETGETGETSDKVAPPPSVDTPTEASTPPEPAAGAKPSYDPKNPFGDIIKESEIKKSSSPPPELPSKPAPHIDDGSSAKLEEAIGSLNSEESSGSGKSSLIPSIIVILILLLVVGGAGYGLWMLLQSPESAEATTETAQATTETAQAVGEAPAEKTSKNPIEKAKDAIAKVPVADVDGITEPSPDSAAPETAAESIAEVASVAPVPAKNVPVTPSASSSTIEASKESVSQYLAGIHIDGIRKGDRPMVLIDGDRFVVGDVVQAATGLKFDGIRDGRLAFRDSHGIVYLKSF